MSFFFLSIKEMKISKLISRNSVIRFVFISAAVISCDSADVQNDKTISNKLEEPIDSKSEKLIPIDSVAPLSISNLISRRFPLQTNQVIDEDKLIESQVKFDFLLGEYSTEPITKNDPKLFRLAEDSSKIIVDFDGLKLILSKEIGNDYLLYTYSPFDLKNEQELASGIILAYKNLLLLFSFESRSGVSDEGLSSITHVDRYTLKSQKILLVHLSTLYFMFEGDEFQERIRCLDWRNCLPEREEGAMGPYLHEITIKKLHEIFLVPCDTKGNNSKSKLTNLNPESNAPTWIYKRIGEIIWDGKPMIWY